MPIFVSRNAPDFVPSTSQKSPDGILTATVDGAGVFLEADFSRIIDGIPEKVLATNYFPDPGFEYGTFQFVALSNGTHTYDSTHARSGSQSYMLTNTGGGNYNPSFNLAMLPGSSSNQASNLGAKVGDTFTWSVWVYVPSTNTQNGYPQTRISSGAVPTAKQAPAFDGPYDQWVQIAITSEPITDPSQGCSLYLYGSQVAGESVWFDDASLTINHDPVDFNGDTPADPDGTSYRWAGTPGDSSSEQYIPAVAPTEDPNNRLKQVRFVRTPDQAVRSGDPAWAPRGRAIAYDMEAPLGVASTWIAYPVFKDGTVGAPSQGVAMTTGTPDNPYDSWIKSTVRPELSARVFVTKDGLPEYTWGARQNLSAVQGNPYPSGAVDEFTAPSPTFTCYTETPEDAQALEDLLTNGREFLFQTLPEYNLRDFYFVPGSFTMSLTGAGVASDSRKWNIPMTMIARPTTTDSPLVIPGRSYDDRADQFQNYDTLAASFPDYDSLAAPA